MQPFPRMVANSRGKVLKVAPSSAARSPPFGIGPAGRARDSVERPLTKELEESSAALGGLLWSRLIRSHVGQVDVDHVGDRDHDYASLTASRCIFACDVVGERRLSLSTCANAEASAELVSGVSDDPDGRVTAARALAGRAEPESDSFGLTRQRSLIESMAARVVKSFAPILSIASRPFAPSRRKVAAVTPPPGKAISAARARRKGVVGLKAETVMLPVPGRRAAPRFLPW